MKTSTFSEAQIAFLFKQAEHATPIGKVTPDFVKEGAFRDTLLGLPEAQNAKKALCKEGLGAIAGIVGCGGLSPRRLVIFRRIGCR